MSEYISKEDISRVLLERIGANKSCLSRTREKGLHETERYFNDLLFEDEQISSLVEGLPSADVRPNIHGHWEGDGHGHIICSACKEANVSTWKSRICPMCGARMDEVKHDE